DPGGIPNPVQVLGPGGSGFLASLLTLVGASGGSFRLAVDIAAPYSWCVILQPVTADGSSVFTSNSTVPLKFTPTASSAGFTDARSAEPADAGFVPSDLDFNPGPACQGAPRPFTAGVPAPASAAGGAPKRKPR